MHDRLLSVISIFLFHGYFLLLQQFAYVLAVEPNIESMKTMWDLEKFSMRCSYLMQYWMDLDDYTGKFYLFHEGFLSVLFVPGDVWCI